MGEYWKMAYARSQYSFFVRRQRAVCGCLHTQLAENDSESIGEEEINSPPE